MKTRLKSLNSTWLLTSSRSSMSLHGQFTQNTTLST